MDLDAEALIMPGGASKLPSLEANQSPPHTENIYNSLQVSGFKLPVF